LRRRSIVGPEVNLALLKKQDVIFHSLESRKATGALTNTIPIDKSIVEVVFKLKIKGAMPKLKEV